jgi:hypothetical protein
VTDEELVYLRRLRAETQKRHNELEIQAARYGPNRVPAEVVIEIREAEESLRRLDAKLLQVSVPQRIQDATGPEASLDVLRHEVKELRDQVGTMWRYLESMILEMRDDTRRWREDQAESRRVGTLERRGIEILLAIGVIVAIFLATR